MIKFLNIFLSKNKKYKVTDYIIGIENKFNFKFKNIDIIILNQYLFKIINVDKIFLNNKEILNSEILNDKKLILKPIIIKRKKKIILNDLGKRQINEEKNKIIEFFNNIDKQDQNNVFVEKILNNIYYFLYKYKKELESKNLSLDNFYKYNNNKLYDYCIKYKIKLKQIKEKEEYFNGKIIKDEKTEEIIIKEIKNEKTLEDSISEDFFNIFGENIKK